MRPPRATLCVAPLATLLVVMSCDEFAGSACTAEFRAIPVIVTENAGAPADSVDFTVTLLRTGERLEHTAPGPNPEGIYRLIDDGATTKLSASGDHVRAVAIKGAGVVQADFVIDVPGGCHVHKLSGPDTLPLP